MLSIVIQQTTYLSRKHVSLKVNTELIIISWEATEFSLMVFLISSHIHYKNNSSISGKRSHRHTEVWFWNVFFYVILQRVILYRWKRRWAIRSRIRTRRLSQAHKVPTPQTAYKWPTFRRAGEIICHWNNLYLQPHHIIFSIYRAIFFTKSTFWSNPIHSF